MRNTRKETIACVEEKEGGRRELWVDGLAEAPDRSFVSVMSQRVYVLCGVSTVQVNNSELKGVFVAQKKHVCTLVGVIVFISSWFCFSWKHLFVIVR